MRKPCIGCSRVADPQNCEDKSCRAWRRWFVESWDSMRREPRLCRETMPKIPEGTVIGGQHYALPHRVRSYLGTDPCCGCLCPRDLCVIPCRVKRSWDMAQQLVQ